MKFIIENKNKLFWILQITGWTFFTVAYAFYKPGNHFSSLRGSYLFLLTFIIGLIITTGLRYLYRFLYKKTRSIILLALGSVTATLVCLLIWEPVDVLISMPLWTEENLAGWIDNYAPFTFQRYYQLNLFWFLFLLIWSVLYFTIKFWLDWQYQKDRADKALILAQQAQLQMLRYQLNPHFLFNSLNSIRAMIDEDVKAAKGMVTELSEFLRYSLLFDNDTEKPLGQELEAIKNYFSIEKKRYEEKLKVEFKVTPEAENYRVLSFMLQPFVENAVKYGMLTSAMPLRITISAQVTGNQLIIDIRNSGKWVEPTDNLSISSDVPRTGKGLDNVTMRLRTAYPDQHILDIQKNDDSVNVHMEIFNH